MFHEVETGHMVFSIPGTEPRIGHCIPLWQVSDVSTLLLEDSMIV